MSAGESFIFPERASAMVLSISSKVMLSVLISTGPAEPSIVMGFAPGASPEAPPPAAPGAAANGTAAPPGAGTPAGTPATAGTGPAAPSNCPTGTPVWIVSSPLRCTSFTKANKAAPPNRTYRRFFSTVLIKSLVAAELIWASAAAMWERLNCISATIISSGRTAATPACIPIAFFTILVSCVILVSVRGSVP